MTSKRNRVAFLFFVLVIATLSFIAMQGGQDRALRYVEWLLLAISGLCLIAFGYFTLKARRLRRQAQRPE